MQTRTDIFEGDDPFVLAKAWLAEAEKSELNDANAIALATVDATGMPNVRVVLLKEIEDDAFVFYTNYESAKGKEIAANAKAAFVMHWKSLGRQIRVRGHVAKEDGAKADAYFASRAEQSRLGAWASAQSRPLASREALMAEVDRVKAERGTDPPRPPHWGGFRITPTELEFWSDGAFRLHDRFQWTASENGNWKVRRLNP